MTDYSEQVKFLRDWASDIWKRHSSSQDVIELRKAADAIEALAAENKLLREYYEAREAISKVGLFIATDAMIKREKAARAVLGGGE